MLHLQSFLFVEPPELAPALDHMFRDSTLELRVTLESHQSHRAGSLFPTSVLAYTHTHTHSHTHSHTLTHILTHTLTHTHSHIHALSHTHTEMLGKAERLLSGFLSSSSSPPLLSPALASPLPFPHSILFSHFPSTGLYRSLSTC